MVPSTPGVWVKRHERDLSDLPSSLSFFFDRASVFVKRNVDTPLKKGIAESGSAEGVRSCNLTDKFAKKFFRGKNVDADSTRSLPFAQCEFCRNSEKQ